MNFTVDLKNGNGTVTGTAKIVDVDGSETTPFTVNIQEG
jgi:hypothetical protein